jgi:hypothetical protein
MSTCESSGSMLTKAKAGFSTALAASSFWISLFASGWVTTVQPMAAFGGQ